MFGMIVTAVSVLFLSYIFRKTSINFCKAVTTDVLESLWLSMHEKLMEEIKDDEARERCLSFLKEEVQKETGIAIREMNREQTTLGAGKPWEKRQPKSL